MDTLGGLKHSIDASAFGQLLGMELLELSPGFARAALTVRQEHFGWHGRVYGGVIISLIDHAWGAACNSTDDRLHVAAQLNTHILSTAPVGERLEAEARVLHAGRTTDLTEITVRDGSGKVIAVATGTTVALGKKPTT